MTEDAEHWQELQRLFALADATPPAERDRVLEEACADAELRKRVLKLLRAAELSSSNDGPHGLCVGAYRFIRLLGSGGVGSVYLAERRLGEAVQFVALKMLAPHAVGRGYAERFDRERQILAQLEHANITRLVDAGLSESGQAYLVTEFVDGLPLDEYVKQRNLTVDERLALFGQVFAALEYAHQHLIVHLDLKPSNILVKDDGVVKLLDFGTAKLLRVDGLMTATVMATPAYASPEQMRLEPLTTASDIYSLGVMMYELVVGERPARTDVVFPKSVPRDLQAILGRCLADQRGERYGTVSALADDVKRFRSGLPVQARTQSVFYRAARFGARHKARLLTAGAMALVVMALGLSEIRNYEQARREEQRLKQVRALSKVYMTDVLNEVSKLPGSIEARRMIVEQASRSLHELMSEDPHDPELRRTLAAVYAQLGDIEGRPFSVSEGDTTEALKSYKKAEALAADAERTRDWRLLGTQVEVELTEARIYSRLGDSEKAIRTMRKALEGAKLLAEHAPGDVLIEHHPSFSAYALANRVMGYVMLNAAKTPEDFRKVVEQLRMTVEQSKQVEAAHREEKTLSAVASQYLGFAYEGLAVTSGERQYFDEAVRAHSALPPAVCGDERRLADAELRRSCSDAWNELSWALHNAGRGAEAEHAARTALGYLEPIANSEKGSVETQQDLAATYLHLGAAENVEKQYGAAIADLQRAEALLEEIEQKGDQTAAARVLKNVKRQKAKALAASGKRKAAIEEMMSALALVEGNARVPEPEVREVKAELAELKAR